MTEYQDEAPFNSSMMVHFRNHLTNTVINEINEEIVKAPINRGKDKPDDTDGNSDTKDTPNDPMNGKSKNT
jgi:IS5 family transposase